MENDIKEGEVLEPENKREFSLQEAVQNELMGFLQSYIQKLSGRNELQDRIKTEILLRLEKPEQVSLPALIRLLEIVNKDDTDRGLGVLKAISETSKTLRIKDETDPEKHKNGATVNPYSQQEIEQSKKLLKILDVLSGLGIAEISQEELDRIKNK